MSDVDKHSPVQTHLALTDGHPRHERPIWIWDLVSGRFIWANGAGISFWSARSLDGLQGLKLSALHPALLAVRNRMPFDHEGTALDMALEFPGIAEGQVYAAICRPVRPDCRETVIVELKGVSHEVEQQKRQRVRRPLVGGEDAMDEALPADADDASGAEADLTEPDAAGEVQSAEKSVPPRELSPRPARIALARTAPDFKIVQQAEETAGPQIVSEGEAPTAASRETGGNPVLSERTEDRLHELARLIRAAGQQRDKEAEPVPQAARVKMPDAGQRPAAPVPLEPARDEAADGAERAAHPSAVESEAPRPAIAGRKLVAPLPDERAAARDYWEHAGLDLAALAGVSDADELERLLAEAPVPLALLNFQKMIAANELFLAEFGYGTFDGLMTDGADWILPRSRLALRAFFEASPPQPMVLHDLRLRSGRKIQRPLYLRPLRLVKFDRVIAIAGLDDWPGEEESFDAPEAETVSRPEVAQAPDAAASKDQAGLIEDITSIPLLSAISHEVRTPLNVIIGFAEIMARAEFGPLGIPGEKGAEKYRGYVDDIQKSARHALSLINDLLDLTKLRAGRWELAREPSDLNLLVRQQLHLMRELAAKAGVRLRSDLEETLPLLTLDPRAVRQIMFNLVANSIKFSDDGAVVRVITERYSDDLVALTVADEGRGMQAEEIARAMQPFQQISDGDISPGTGLGLPIAKALAEANEMQFAIESEKGVGTHAIMLIPI